MAGDLVRQDDETQDRSPVSKCKRMAEENKVARPGAEVDERRARTREVKS